MTQTLLIGVGSHFGDDRLGWCVTELLSTHLPPGVHATSISSPDALFHLDTGVDRWIIVDAGVDPYCTGSVLQWEWPLENIPALRPRGTHDLGLIETLKLVEALGTLPRRVKLWIGFVSENGAPLEFSETTRTLAREIADRILDDLTATSFAT